MVSFRTYGYSGVILILLAAGRTAVQPTPLGAGATSKARTPSGVDAYGDPLPPGAIARLGTTRLRLRGSPSILGFAADGKTLLVFTRDGVLRLLDPATGRPARQFLLPDINGVAHASGDGRTVAVRDSDGAVVFVNCVTGKMKGRITREELFPRQDTIAVSGPSLLLSQDGKFLAVSGRGVKDRIEVAWFDTTRGKAVHRVYTDKHTPAGSMAFTRDGKLLAFVEGADGGKLRLRQLDTASGKEVRSVNLPVGAVDAVRFLPDGKAFLTWGRQNPPVLLLDAVTGKEIRSFADPETASYGHELSTDGKALAVAGPGKARIWEVATGKALRTFTHPALGGEPTTLFFTPDGKSLAAAGKYGLVLWDVATGKELYATGGHVAPVLAVAFSPDAKRLVSAALDKTLRVWEFPAGKEDRRFLPFAKGADDESDRVQIGGAGACFTPDGKAVLAATPGLPVQVWDARTARALRQVGEGKEVYPAALSADGKLLAGGTADGRLIVYDTATGKEVRALVWHRAQPREPGERVTQFGSVLAALAFAPDGRTLVAAGIIEKDNQLKALVRLWEVSTGRERHRATLLAANLNDDSGRAVPDALLRGETRAAVTFSLAYSPDGKRLAVGLGKVIYLWDTATGKELRQFAGTQVVAGAVALSPDGKLLAAGRSDGGIRLWRADTGAVLGDFPGHERAVLCLAFSADGKALASGSDDSTVLLWDVARLPLDGAHVEARWSAEELEALWSDLSGADAAKAFRAMAAFSAAPQSAVAFMKGKLRPAPPADPKQLTRLLAELDSKRYPVRSRAMRELAALGELARPALEGLLAKQPPLETRKRVEALLEGMRGPVTSPDQLQALRGVELLERVGSPAARAVLRA